MEPFDWPKHSDGRPYRLGEMTPAQRRAAWVAAVEKTKAYFERPEVKAGIAAVCGSNNERPNR